MRLDAESLTAQDGSCVRLVASIDRGDKFRSGRIFEFGLDNGSLGVARPCVDGIARPITIPARQAHTTRRHSTKLLAERRRGSMGWISQRDRIERVAAHTHDHI